MSVNLYRLYGNFISCIIDIIQNSKHTMASLSQFDWLVVLGLTALTDSISVYIGPSHKERETEERKDR